MKAGNAENMTHRLFSIAEFFKKERKTFQCWWGEKNGCYGAREYGCCVENLKFPTNMAATWALL